MTFNHIMIHFHYTPIIILRVIFEFENTLEYATTANLIILLEHIQIQ